MGVWTAWDVSAWEPPPCDRELRQWTETTTRGKWGTYFFLFLYVYLFLLSLGPPSLSCLFSLIISLCIQTEDRDVALFRISRCGVFYLFIFLLFSFLVLLVFPLPFLPCVRLEMFKKCAIHTYMHTHTHQILCESSIFSYKSGPCNSFTSLLTSSSQASL